jgi:phospholipid transport system substrate-binding protein
MHRRSALRLLALVLAGPICSPALTAPAPREKSIFDFVDRLLAASSALLTTAWESEQRARQDCRKLLVWAFDVPGMVRFALGPAWNKATARQRAVLRESFETLIVNQFVRQMRSEPKQTFAFIGYKEETKDRVLAVVRTIVPERPEQIWWWRLQAEPDSLSWRVVDLIVEGRSVLLSEREDYARILESNNGNIGAVVEYINKRAGP